MEITLTVPKVYKVKTLYVKAGVRYWEDATVDGVDDKDGTLIPCRNGDRWEPEIDVDTGQILNWKQGVTADIHYKVCDDGLYELIDYDGLQVIEIDGYVPSTMCPKEDGYGDYIIMDIDKNGFIQNWKFKRSDFEKSDFE